MKYQTMTIYPNLNVLIKNETNVHKTYKYNIDLSGLCTHVSKINFFFLVADNKIISNFIVRTITL